MSSKSLPRVLTIYLLVLAVIIVAAHASSSEEEICRDGRCYPRAFAPTTDFTEVLEGQEIPPGLHVRMDFNTGKKEAKLFDSSDSTSGRIILLDDEGKSLSHKLSDVPAGLPSLPKESPRLKESSASIPLSFRKMEELGALLFSVGDDDLFSASLDILRALRVRPRPRNVSRPSRSSRISFIRLISGSFSRRETGFRFFSRLRLWIACQREPEVNAAAD